MNKLPNKIVEEYALGFFGYGSWKAKIWFVGMEEGGGGDIGDVNGRLIAWDQRNRQMLEDCRSFHLVRGERRWHDGSGQLQRTWKQLIRMFLLANGRSDNFQEWLAFQQNEFGKKGGEVCTIELLPLPSPGIGVWNYSSWSSMPWLQSRDNYQIYLFEKRSLAIQAKIKDHRPPIVIFYGSSWLRHWARIAGVGFGQAIDGKLMVGERDGVTYYVTRHPARQAYSYFTDIGKYLRQKHRGVLG